MYHILFVYLNTIPLMGDDNRRRGGYVKDGISMFVGYMTSRYLISHPSSIIPFLLLLLLLLHHPQLSSAAMSGSSLTPTLEPRYLTGDGPGLKEFVDRFDVGGVSYNIACPPTDLFYRSFSLTAMVRDEPRMVSTYAC